MPGGVYGPGDTSAIAQLMRMAYRGMPAVFGPETTLTYAHVDDVADGHILAAERGKPGESYILAGPAIPMGEMVDFWGHLLGRRSPTVRLPAPVVRPFAPVVGGAGSVLHLPPIFSEEATAILGATYMARSDKARAELGWKTRPLQSGMIETFKWIEATEPEPKAAPDRQKQLVGLALAVMVVVALLWFFRRRK
jgi:dihydroflavonol-4-reductase